MLKTHFLFIQFNLIDSVNPFTNLLCFSTSLKPWQKLRVTMGLRPLQNRSFHGGQDQTSAGMLVGILWLLVRTSGIESSTWISPLKPPGWHGPAYVRQQSPSHASHSGCHLCHQIWARGHSTRWGHCKQWGPCWCWAARGSSHARHLAGQMLWLPTGIATPQEFGS